MVEENVIKLRRAQLMIAKEIKRICDLNNINYFLDSVVLFLGMMTWILVCVAMIMRNLYQ